ncbi:hypothetical protein Cgig2_024292 [Carnegiea gigantea]|uniref:Uncharacterized protein n=1 Tax=Carnegiea gigantea TaxID=171969 RepID=A0A9Q1GUE4_9CARY|nr:hypothetical protein Cgig2_024292 [Carnegiea gigantea]
MLGKGDDPARKSAAKGKENKKSSNQIAAKNAPSEDEGLGKDLQIVQEEQALNFEEGVNEKRTYQKAFIMRMTTHSFSSVVVQLNEAQVEAARSMGFASFLKVDLKQIPVKFSKWLVESFDPYAVCFRCLNGQNFPVTTFNVYVTLGVPSEEKENHRNHQSILKYVKDVSQIACLDWWQYVLDKLITSFRHYKESKATKGDKASNDTGAPSFRPKLPLHKPDSEDQIPGTTLVVDANIIVEKEEHCEDVVLDHPNNFMKKDDSVPSYSLGLGLSQPNSQSPIPQTTSVPNPNTIRVNEDDNDGAPLRFPLRTLLS